MNVTWTNHAAERQLEWERKLGITRQVVEEVVLHPEQIVASDRDAQVAQSRHGGGLLRVPFIEVRGERKILTVYWTSRTDRYWIREQNAN